MPPLNCHRRGHIVSPPPERYLIHNDYGTIAALMHTRRKAKYTDIAVRSVNIDTPHRDSHAIWDHPAELTFPHLPQPKLVLDLATPKGYKAELIRHCSKGAQDCISQWHWR